MARALESARLARALATVINVLDPDTRPVLDSLLAMLNSCATGVAVVNIDNGYGAACAAIRVLRAARRSDGDP